MSLKKKQTRHLASPALSEFLRDAKFRRAYEQLLPEYARINARMTQKNQHQLLARHLGLTQRAIERRLRQTHRPNFQKGGVIHLSQRTFGWSALLAQQYGVTQEKYIDLVLQGEIDRIDPLDRRRLIRQSRRLSFRE